MNKSLLLSSLLMGLLMLVACEEEPVYNQLTQDQLRHLYFVDDDFVYNGETVESAGDVRFLLNGDEIVEIDVTTRISEVRTNGSVATNRFNVDGESELDMSSLGFRTVVINVDGSSSEDQQFMSLLISSSDGLLFDTVLPLPAHENLNAGPKELESVTVNGITYDDVYTFLRSDLNQYQFDFDGFERLYFAKDHGFILIETTNGLQLELFNN